MRKAKLQLVLKRQWYDLIDAGPKHEEYLEIKDFWNKRFIDGRIKIGGVLYKPSEIFITFQLGYNKPKFMHYECDGLKIKTGRTEWGAEPNKEYHVLKLGKRIWM